MSEFVARVRLEVNGQEITDFSAVTEKEYDLAVQVKLMGGTGHARVTPRYQVSVDYEVPVAGEFDWDSVQDARLTIEYVNGRRKTYTGVWVLKVGEGKADGEKQVTKTIDLSASGLIKE